MSITRLQQARQMYAMGQRVGRIAFGGGGSYSSQGGYQGQGGAATGGAKGSKAGGEGTGTDGQGGTGNGPDNSFSGNTQVVDTTSTKYTEKPLTEMTINPLDIKEQYKIGTKIDPPSAFTSMPSVTFDQPYMTKGLETKRKDNYIDAFNLSNSTYKPVNIPPFIPGSTLINTAGNFLGNLGYKKNTQFFADNVAGKYGYGYDEDAYKNYMKARQLGTVNAYGRPLTEGELRLRDGDGDGGGGIMDIVDDTTDDTTDDNTTDDELILRFLGADSTLDPAAAGLANTDELRAMLLERAKNLYTT